MKKRLIAAVFALFLLICLVSPVMAEDAVDGTAEQVTEEVTDQPAEETTDPAADQPAEETAEAVVYEQLPRLVDNADLLSGAEETALLAELDEISLRQGSDVVIITVDSIDPSYTSISSYADDVFDYNGFGLGEDRSGILLLLSMDTREWAISTRGSAITAFTDAGQEYIIGQIKSDLSDESYAAAFTKFAELSDEFMTQAATGTPYDTGNLPKTPLSAMWIFIALGVGLAAAFIITAIMKSGHKSVRMQAAADNYIRDDSMNLIDKQDIFLYKRVDEYRREKNDSSGGSSTHESSSGAEHGGSSGTF